MQKETLSPYTYPAMISTYSMAFAWFAVAVIIAGAILIRPEAFQLQVRDPSAITFASKMALIATSLKYLGVLAPLTQITQKWHIRALKRVQKMKGKLLLIRPTYQGAIFMGLLLTASGNALSIYLGNDTFAWLKTLLQFTMSS